MQDKLQHAADHIKYYKENASALPFHTLEIGTGWYPVVPIALYLSGAQSITTVDIYPYLTLERLQNTCSKFVEWNETGRLTGLLGKIDETRMNIVKKGMESSLNQSLANLNITHIVSKSGRLPAEDNSFSIVTSNNTLEHIYPIQLEEIIKECWRIVAPGGIMSHFIDLSDHFAHMDASITIYNFLKFSKKQWKWIDNHVQPQSRLRIDDYRSVFEKLGIPIHQETNRPFDLDKLYSVKLSKDFENKTANDLAVSHSHIISQKP